MRGLCNPLHFVYVVTCISIQVYFTRDISPLVLYIFAWTGNFFSTDSISIAFSCLNLLGLTEHKLCHNASLLLDMAKKNVWWVWTLTSSQPPEGIAWKYCSWGKPPTVRFQKTKHSLTFQSTSFMQTTQRWLYIYIFGTECHLPQLTWNSWSSCLWNWVLGLQTCTVVPALWNAGYRTRGLRHALQVLYPLSCTPGPSSPHQSLQMQRQNKLLPWLAGEGLAGAQHSSYCSAFSWF